MAGRPIFAFLSLILTAGAIVLILLTFLSGTVNSAATNKIYFIQVDTSRIPSAPPITRWTFWNLCDSDSTSSKSSCDGIHPAFPFDPPSGRNFGTTEGVPEQFVGTRKFFLLTRFAFAFVLIALVFAAGSLITGLLALCAKLGAWLSSLMVVVAAFFQALASIMMTVAFIQGRNAFRSNDQDATIGSYAFGFMWSALAALILSMVFYSVAGTSRKESTNHGSSRQRGGLFGGRRRRSTRSNRSRGSLRKDYA